MGADSDPIQSSRSRIDWRWMLFVAVAWLGAVLGNGPSRPLEEHEVFVARTAIEMQRNGDWLVPQFNGEPRLEKPPLAYWAAIAAHKVFGESGDRVGELAARLPAALSGVALIAVTWALARATFRDRRAAFAAAAMWATSAGFYGYVHNARPEMLYALFTASSMLGFVRIASGEGRVAANALLAWGCAALAMLTKGPFLPLFAIAGIVLAIVVHRRRERASVSIASNLRPWLGVLLVLGTSGAYFAYVAAHVPGAIDFWANQMFHRTAAGSDHGSWTEILTLPYLYTTPSMLAPWLFFIPFAVMLAWRTYSLAVRYQAFAFAVAIACLSLSRNGHGYYTLPVLPLACSLMGGAAVALLDRLRASKSGSRKLALALGAHVAIAAVVAVAIGVAAFSEYAHASETDRIMCTVIAALALAAAVGAWIVRGSAERCFGAIALSFSLELAGIAAGGVGWDAERFSKADLARAIARTVPASLPIASTDEGHELVVYYADRTVPQLGWRELPDFLRAHPGALVLGKRSKFAQRNLACREVLTETGPPDRDPLVLVELTAP
jgi:4-amino-4-deoxy-L-arabinose transferase-like glycosyltransferase